MFAARAAAEIVACDQDGRTGIGRAVEQIVRFLAQRLERASLRDTKSPELLEELAFARYSKGDWAGSLSALEDPALAKRLNAAGIVSSSQLAVITDVQLDTLAHEIKVSLDKIKKAQWVEQAKALNG